MHPMLYPRPFTAAGWMFENKFDGFRALVRKHSGEAGLISRNGRSMARAFPEVIQAIAMLPRDAVLDAELVVSDERGHPAWERLRRRSVMTRPIRISDASRSEPAALCVFDLLSLDGEDLRSLAMLERKRRLADLLPSAPGFHFVTHIEEHGALSNLDSRASWRSRTTRRIGKGDSQLGGRSRIQTSTIGDRA